MKMREITAAVLALVLVLAASGCGTSSSGSDQNEILVISDVHFTPFSDPDVFDQLVAANASQWASIFESTGNSTLPGYGQECNYALFEKALDAMAEQEKNPLFLIFPGDILAHHFNDLFYQYYGSQDQEALHAFIHKTVEFFAIQIRRHYDSVPVFFTLGNNDSYAGDYSLIPGGEFLEQTSALFRTYFLAGVQADGYTASYQAGGYYTALINDNSTLVVSLNSVLFSHRRPEPTPPGPDQNAAWDQLDWLAQVLENAAARNQKVLMLTHVPPGADIYSTQHKYLDEQGMLTGAELMWHSAYHERFMALVDAYKDILSIIYAGHTHMDEYRLASAVPSEYAGVPVLVTPSISPLFGNNPGYRVVEQRGDGPELDDFQAYTLDLRAQVPAFEYVYDFREQYGVGAPNSENLAALYQLMAGGDEIAKNAYILHYYGGNIQGSGITGHNWPVYLCGIRAMTVQGMMDCVNN